MLSDTVQYVGWQQNACEDQWLGIANVKVSIKYNQVLSFLMKPMKAFFTFPCDDKMFYF